MFDFMAHLFDTSGFPPRWHCGNWTTGHGWLHILSDLGVWSAYVAIPCVLVFFALRRRDLPFKSIFLLFGAFILACGTTHLMEATLFWWPAYRLAGVIKLFTAIVSWATVVALVPVVPRVLAMRSPRELEREVELRKRAEEAFQQANTALERRVEERTAELARSNLDLEQFAYVASHDLQEPLRAVAGCVQVLKTRYQGQLEGRADELITHTVEGVSRMQALIEDLLSYSRVGTRGNAFEPCDSNVILAQALANLEAAIAEGGAVVTHDQLPVVKADAAQLTQLFQNLISNAIKFRSLKPSRIQISASRNADQWLFSVKDNGIGMQPEYFERIFVIFQRLHTRTEYPGTGLGLAICKKIVERHGGRIFVESEFGQCSTFSFTISDKEANP